MDPLSVSGLALGAVSLTFQVFSGCVQGYELLSTAKHMPADLQFLRVRLKTEEHRLLDWGKVANLSEDDRLFNRSVKLNRHLVNDILHETQMLLLDCCKVGGQEKAGSQNAQPTYTEDQETQEAKAIHDLQTRFPHSSDSVKSKALHWVRSTRKYPKQLHWAIFDKKKFEELLANLGRLNDFMERLMDTASQEMLYQAQQETFLQVLQLNSKVDDLLQIMNASSAHGSNDDTPLPNQLRYNFESVLEGEADEDRARKQTRKLVQLARFKILNTAIDRGTLDDHIARQIDIQQSLPSVVDPQLDPTKWKRANSSIESGETPVRSEGQYDYQETQVPVWVEWKYYTRHPADEGPPKVLHGMVSNLAALLHYSQKPAEFHSPECLGYFDDPTSETPRFGFVFKKPARPQFPDAAIFTLLQLFQSRKPSLTARIRLASAVADSISYLHSTNWLHKGLRSQNILFFDDAANIDFPNPYLCGFDYSRPAEASNLTQAPPQNPEQDIYRHPDVQSSAIRDPCSGGFKKVHDVYSLGVILVEIALWRPIDEILGIENVRKVKSARIKGVRAEILGTREYLDDLQAEAGDMYRNVCAACLKGEFGATDGKKGVSEEARFREEVVQRLGAMVL